MRLCDALPGWDENPVSQPAHHVVGVLPGEGIGPDVVQGAVDVLRAVEAHSPHTFDIRYGGDIGTVALETSGAELSDEVISFCRSIFADGGAVLRGSGGGRFVYDLRARFDLYCKFTCIRPLAALRDRTVLRPEALEDVDLVVVRENMKGIYQGRGERRGDVVNHTFSYDVSGVRRIIDVAVRVALSRRRRLSLVVKPGGLPTVSALWAEVFADCTAGHDLDTRVLEIDHAVYEVVAGARALDVVVAPNMFGDILSDGAALLLGSRGLSFSGDFGPAGSAVFQTGHGAAHDLVGRDVANPLGQILSTAMMLREQFRLHDEAAVIEAAVEDTIAAGICTADIAAPGTTPVGTRAMSRHVAEAVARALQREPLEGVNA